MSPAAVTGIGMVTPLGASTQAVWRRLRAGDSGLQKLPADLFEGASLHAGGVPPPETRPPGADRLVRYAVHAAREAAADARLLTATPPDRIACVIGASKGGVASLAQHALRPWAAPPDLLYNYMPCMASARAAHALGIRGPVMAEAASCATGVACLLRAAVLLERGLADAALAGSSDASLLPLLIAGFRNAGVLSECPDPAAACKPFDRGRDGFIIGEGAAVFALEPLQRARGRGARIYAVLAGMAMGSEAFHETRPDPTGAGLRRTISLALQRAGLAPHAVDYVNAHGTGTRLGDVAEAGALRSGFTPAVPVSSTKPQTGHLLGASSSVEVAIALLALRDSWMPGTLNLGEPDPACALNLVPASGAPAELRTVASVSIGFGGQLGVVIARTQEDAP